MRRPVSAAELSLGITLGIRLRWVAFGAATLLFLFGTAMAISFGVKSPLDYSVFSASAGALLLALHQSGQDCKKAWILRASAIWRRIDRHRSGVVTYGTVWKETSEGTTGCGRRDSRC